MWYACVEMYSGMKVPCCPFVRQIPPPTGQFVCVETVGTFSTEEEAWDAARKRYNELDRASVDQLNKELERWT